MQSSYSLTAHGLDIWQPKYLVELPTGQGARNELQPIKTDTLLHLLILIHPFTHILFHFLPFFLQIS